MKKKLFLTITSLLVIVMMLSVTSIHTAMAVSGAAFTTTNPQPDGPDEPGHCKNGNEAVNCNIYDGKQYVWLNGGPLAAGLEDSYYFFAVLVPGGQADPNDGTPKNLSDDFDTYDNRTFFVSNGTVKYSGTHDFANNKIRLMPYADTTNPGGVYIMAICSLGADGTSYPVNPSDCKYDAFKIRAGETTGYEDLIVAKDANPSFTRTFSWTIEKSVDKTLVKQVGGSATFNYTVKVTKDAGTDSDWQVKGTIQVTNPNPVDFIGVVVTDTLDSADCTVDGGSSVTIPAGETVPLTYTCAYASKPAYDTLFTNMATAAWDQATYNTPSDHANGTADFMFTGPTNKVLDCITVSDSYAGVLGTTCQSKTFTYSRTISVPAFGCASYPNTATIVETGQSASATVTVCGPVKTGALTMGFWQNKNGQDLIKNAGAVSGVCKLTPWLRGYAPFQDLNATASCTTVATYVTNVIKAANASGASMNAMLKAQMLATALDVYFSDSALGGYKIAAAPIGAVAIDLTSVCKNIAGGCTVYENVSGAFGGATHLTVSQMLTYASSQSNTGGSVWYGQVKATQELAKDAFDAINNQVAFAY